MSGWLCSGTGSLSIGVDSGSSLEQAAMRLNRAILTVSPIFWIPIFFFMKINGRTRWEGKAGLPEFPIPCASEGSKGLVTQLLPHESR